MLISSLTILSIVKEKTMNKQQFTDRLVEFATNNKYRLSDIVVSHGGSMLLMGLRHETGDIDVAVHHDIFIDYVKKGYVPVQIGDGISLISVTKDIDIHVGMELPTRPNFVSPEGVHYHGLQQTLDDYLHLNRAKDQGSIKMLQRLM